MTKPLCPDYSFPRYCQLEVTRACNARCTFCPMGIGQASDRGYMSDQVFQTAADQLLEHRDSLIRVTMYNLGEPLLDPKLEDRVQYLKEGGIAEIALATNVQLLTEDRTEKLLKAGLDVLRLSISTVNREKYPLIRRGLDFDTVMANADRAFAVRDRLRPSTYISVSMEKSELITDEDVHDWLEHWRPLVKPRDMLKVHPCFNYVVENRQGLGRDWTKPCHNIFKNCCVFYDGGISMCPQNYRDQDESYFLGNVLQQPMAEIWNCAQALHFRQMHREGRRNELNRCRGCDIWTPGAKENIIVGRDPF